MADSRDSSVEADVSEAFAVLGDETRLTIIRVLGDAGSFDPLPFSTLQTAVGIEDNGRFNYHLEKLVGRFIERTEEGYRLLVPGVQVYQAIQAGTYRDHEPLGPFDVDADCHCGADRTCRYEGFRFVLECTACEGGTVRYPVEPESFDRDDPDSLLRAADRRLKRDVFSMELGFCPYCAGAVESEFRGLRPSLSGPESGEGRAAARRTCTRCHWLLDYRTHVVALVKPRVAGSFAQAGVDTFETVQWSDAYEWEERVVGTDPVEIELTMRVDGVERVVTFDEAFEVLAVREP